MESRCVCASQKEDTKKREGEGRSLGGCVQAKGRILRKGRVNGNGKAHV